MADKALKTYGRLPAPADPDSFDLYEPAPEGETPDERKRRQARIRKRKQRLAEAKAALEKGVIPVSFDAYPGTAEDVATICDAGEFEEFQEAITLILRNVAELARRDRHAFAKFISIPSRKEADQ